MAHIKPLPHSDINEFLLTETGKLNSIILNNLFTKLVENDNFNFSNSDYIPNIWECKWFTDDRIVGYNKGYCVWSNGIMDKFEFLSAYQDNVFDYINSIPDIINNDPTGFLIKPLGDWYDKFVISASEPSDAEQWELAKETWLKAMDGYTLTAERYIKEFNVEQSSYVDVLETYTVKEYSPIYRIGELSNQIEIYISLIDNNKNQLGDSKSWRKISSNDNIKTTDDMFNELVKTEIDLLLKDHIDNYHYGISSYDENENLISAFILQNLSGFSPDEVYNRTNMYDHNRNINQQGFDYVVDFNRYIVPSKITSNITYLSSSDDGTTTVELTNVVENDLKLYRWYRKWNSGYIEQGGTIKADNGRPYTTINLDISYDYDTQLCMYGNYDTTMKYNIVKTEESYEEISGISLTNRYTIQVTPVIFDQFNDLSTYHHLYTDIELSGYNLSKDRMASPIEIDKKLTNEVHHIKNNSFRITNTKGIEYYNFYVTGFKTKQQ